MTSHSWSPEFATPVTQLISISVSQGVPRFLNVLQYHHHPYLLSRNPASYLRISETSKTPLPSHCGWDPGGCSRASRGLHIRFCQPIRYYGDIFLYLMGNAGIKIITKPFSVSLWAPYLLRWTCLQPFAPKIRLDVT